jgi:type VI secretion system protein ImpK
MTETSTGGVAGEARMPAFPSFHARVDAARYAHNPLIEAARPLLQALADMPAEMDGNAVAQRHEWLEYEVRMFSKVCAELQLRADQVQIARYCLCSALDEAAMQTAWGNGTATGVEWNSRSLAVVSGQDRQGADRVYRFIEEVMCNPYENLDLIGVIQNILDLGFKGRYRFETDGQNKLMSIRRRVHHVVVTGGSNEPWHLPYRASQVRGDVPRHPARLPAIGPLPPWQVDPWVRPAAPRKRRPWVAVALLCAILLGAAGYAAYERSLADRRAAQSALPIDALAHELSEHLGSEIAAGTLSLNENAQHTALTLRFSDMFPPGEAAVNAWMRPLIATAGQEIASTMATAQVTGYTDSLPVGKSMLASNTALSEERAKQVMQILLAAGLPAGRVSIVGKGDANPIAGNETAEGRTKNRRVEITVSE